MVVGRDQRMAHLVIRDAVISRKQCSFHYGVDGLYLTDNRSACGTMVGGVMINHATRVHPGDVIFIGNSMLTIERA